MRFVILGLATALLVSAPAQARKFPVNVRISTDGLDVATPQGAAAFQERAHTAIKEACEAPGLEAYSPAAARDCYTAAMAQALAKLESRKQTQLALNAK